MVPVVTGMPAVRWQTGGDWFAEQNESVQRDILGPGRFELWQSGKVKDFARFAKHVDNPIWGGAVVSTPLGELLA
jgi:hypothetical protein